MTDRDRARTFLQQMIRVDRLRDDDDIFALGFVNSLFAMQLIAWIEQEFALAVGDADLDINNFKSVNAITAFVGRKRAPVSAVASA
jgi:methoxymalonate biosynthesis acyl carrier protein